MSQPSSSFGASLPMQLDPRGILVLTHDGDVGSERVIALLRESGELVHTFDPGRLDLRRLSVRVGGGRRGAEAVLPTPAGEVRTGSLKSIWYRKPSVKKDLVVKGVAELELREFANVLVDLWDSLDCFWCPAPPSTLRTAQRKIHGLVEAQAVGFEVPDTLVSNDERVFRDFLAEHDCRVISKLAGGQPLGKYVPELGRFTEPVSRQMLARPSGLRRCPMIFQPNLPKHRELRVTVVDRSVFAAEIASQASRRTSVDWRRGDDSVRGWQPAELPPEIARMCAELVQRLHLSYGALDLVHTPDDRYLFLEINPSGQFGWLEMDAGLPISAAICALLRRGAPAPLSQA